MPVEVTNECALHTVPAFISLASLINLERVTVRSELDDHLPLMPVMLLSLNLYLIDGSSSGYL